MNKIALVLGTVLLIASEPADAETLNNAKIIQLTRARLGDEAIVAKLRVSNAEFDTSTEALIALRNAGVSNAVITAMIQAGSAEGPKSAPAPVTIQASESPDPRILRPPGIYMLSTWFSVSKMQRVSATTANQTRGGGLLGYAFSGGIVPITFKMVVPGAHADSFTSRSQPIFYFYLEQNIESSGSGTESSFPISGHITSPSDFVLVRFKVKDDHREARVGDFSVHSARAGIKDEDQIPFTANTIVPGVFEIRPSADLEPGEYGFVLSATSGRASGVAALGVMTSRIFDFSVTNPAVTQ